MKLKNKLLPLVGVSAVCATVAPIALTSCGSGMVELTKTYNSKITDAPGYNKWTVKFANEYYFSHLAEKPEIFADDFYWSMSRERSIDVTTHQEKISNISLKKQQFSAGQFYTVSFEREFSITWDYTEYNTHYVDVNTGKVKFVNVPFTVVPNSDGLWYITIYSVLAQELWNGSKECSMFATLERHVNTTYTSGSIERTSTRDYSYEYTVDSIETSQELQKMSSDIQTIVSNLQNYGYSHYLFNIEPNYEE